MRWTALLSAFLLASCVKQPPNLTPAASQEVVESIPKWCSAPASPTDALVACKSATSADMQLAIDKAQMAGRLDLAQQMETRFSALQRRFQAETGLAGQSELMDQFTQTYQSVVDVTLVGTRTRQQTVNADGGIYRAFVLVDVPIGSANQQLVEKIKANTNLRTKLESTAAFMELDQEVAKARAATGGKPPLV